MDAFFTNLGRTVLESWKRENFALAKFPAIAQAALDERPPVAHVDLPAFLREFLLNDEQAFQTRSGFGQPELVVYHHARFYIQVLFWLDGTTDIHQHEFSGAFHVLAGSSIHAHFELAQAREITSHFRLGDLRLQKIELLETGRTVPIISGPAGIHSLFHLDTPSVTVVVRTHNDPGSGPQFNYLLPHVAFDPLASDALTARREQILDALAQIEDPDYSQLVLDMLSDSDFERGFGVLRDCHDHLRSLGEWETALAVFQDKHGALAAGVAVTLEEIERRNVIIGLRSTITEPEHRFFLALLLNVPTRADLLTLVAQRFPEEAPVETVVRWAEELMEMSDYGAEILDAHFPVTLAIANEAQPHLFVAALRYFLEGGGEAPAPLRSLAVAELEQLRAAFAESSLGLLLRGSSPDPHDPSMSRP